MTWWQATIAAIVAVWLTWLGVRAVREHRAGTLRSTLSGRWPDGCPKPLFERAIRSDGSRRPVFPRRHDHEIDDLEHRWDHGHG